MQYLAAGPAPAAREEQDVTVSMTQEDALAQAEAELNPRAHQMTVAELSEAITDRTRELLGLTRLARLEGSGRLSAEEEWQLMAGISAMISDYEHVGTYGDARVSEDGQITVLFRFTERPDIGLQMSATLENYGMDLALTGRALGCRFYDLASPERVKKVLDDAARRGKK